MAAQAFIYTVNGTLDGKGRVCIPADYRAALAAQGTAGVYLRKSYLDASLEGFGDVLMNSLLAKQAQADPVLGSDSDELTGLILEMTTLLPRDENGRVRLPEDFISYANLKDRVVFVGRGDRFHIWEPDAYAAIFEEKQKRAREIHAAARAARGGAQ